MFGVLDDVLEGETEDGGVFDLLEIKQESNLSLQRFTFKRFIFKTVLRIKIGKSRLKWKSINLNYDKNQKQICYVHFFIRNVVKEKIIRIKSVFDKVYWKQLVSFNVNIFVDSIDV